MVSLWWKCNLPAGGSELSDPKKGAEIVPGGNASIYFDRCFAKSIAKRAKPFAKSAVTLPNL